MQVAAPLSLFLFDLGHDEHSQAPGAHLHSPSHLLYQLCPLSMPLVPGRERQDKGGHSAVSITHEHGSAVCFLCSGQLVQVQLAGAQVHLAADWQLHARSEQGDKCDNEPRSEGWRVG